MKQGANMAVISWDDFDKVDMRVGVVMQVEEFPQAKSPSYLLTIDFGPTLGIKRSSAAIKGDYSPEALINRKVIAVVNFPPKQIANHMSQALVLAALNVDGSLHLLQPGEGAEPGSRVR